MPAGTIERAELVAAVDELVAWKKSFMLKQAEEIAWKFVIKQDIQTIIEGCLKIVETEELIGKRVDMLNARLDIVNKRLRKLEEAR